ncbi:hypothetical protein AS850_11480 [Frondihabitans sp. 762G35]|nr:hypothetical protein AS850_11480 [Frondihabitans sp. 762G35]
MTSLFENIDQSVAFGPAFDGKIFSAPRLVVVITRRDAALRLDIPLEMAHRHGIPARLSEAELRAIEQDPPAWLVQSRANRTSAKKVWVHLECVVCSFAEDARPKKWWPEWTYLACDYHAPYQVPDPADGFARREVDGIGSRFIAFVDERP